MGLLSLWHIHHTHSCDIVHGKRWQRYINVSEDNTSWIWYFIMQNYTKSFLQYMSYLYKATCQIWNQSIQWELRFLWWKFGWMEWQMDRQTDSQGDSNIPLTHWVGYNLRNWLMLTWEDDKITRFFMKHRCTWIIKL